ncbi:MAG: valine--tRNA ligase, partial [Anaerolineales bacterium]
IAVSIFAGERYAYLDQSRLALQSLAGVNPDTLVIAESLEKPEGAVPLVVRDIELYLPLEGMLDLKQERIRLAQELAEVEGQILRLEALLEGPFAERAPDQVVAKEQARLEGFKETRQKLEAQLGDLR